MKIQEIGKKVDNNELVGLFEADEGDIELIYGRIGEGKTTEAVRRMLEVLQNGGVIYTNIKLDLDSFEFDDRGNIRVCISNILFFRKRYYVFRKENYHYFNPDDYEPQEMVEFLSKLTDCEIYYDEGHWLLDSYEGTKISKARRKLVLETRHFNRKLVLITQRPTAIAVSARGNVNRFWKCTKLLTWPLLVMKVEEYQDMIGETVDESVRISRQLHIFNSRVFRAFNTHYLRGGIKRSQEVYLDAYDLNFIERIKLIWYNLYREIFPPLMAEKFPKEQLEQFAKQSKLPF